MFSDRYRTIKIIGLLTILIILAWYSNAARQPLTLADCLNDPERFAGREVPIFLEARVLGISPECLRVSQPDGPIDVMIPHRFKGMVPRDFTLEDIAPGQAMEALTVFRLPGYLELKELRIAPLRPLKIIISIIPALIVLIVLAASLRRESGRLVIKEEPEVS